MSSTAQSIGLLVLRAGFGLFMLLGHGVGKVSKFGDLASTFPDPLGMGSKLSLMSAIGAEVGCAALLVLGIGTRIAAIPLAFTMGVALFVVHSADPWATKELAAVFLTAFVALVFTGPGRFSIDARIAANRRKKAS